MVEFEHSDVCGATVLTRVLLEVRGNVSTTLSHALFSLNGVGRSYVSTILLVVALEPRLRTVPAKDLKSIGSTALDVELGARLDFAAGTAFLG